MSDIQALELLAAMALIFYWRILRKGKQGGKSKQSRDISHMMHSEERRFRD